MKVIGLLSSQEEAIELRYIAQVCTVAERIRFVVHLDRAKKLIRK
ncbi:MAG: hypothetical protein V1726_06830 [Methanobacteriota archaeon]